MNIQKEYRIPNNAPIVICFVHEDARQKFIDTHTEHTGFFVQQCYNKNSSVFYWLYTSGYCFKAYTYTDKENRMLGFFISSSPNPMTQNQTITSLTQHLHIFGLKDRYIINSKGREVTRNMTGRGFKEIMSLLDGHNKSRQVEDTDYDLANEKKLQKSNERQRMYTSAINFYSVQDELLDAERDYVRDHFFSIDYDGVSTVTQSHNEGTVFSFKLSQRITDELQKKLKPDTAVDILKADSKTIHATVTKYNAAANSLHMNVTACDFSQIPQAAKIIERENISYRHVKKALYSIKNRTAENSFMENLLFGGEIKPIPEKIKFENDKFNAKQLDAINKAINTEDFLLIQGPPGTGKTQIIVEMIKHFVGCGQRVLICSQNNHAVDNVLKKCLSLNFPTPEKQPIHCLRIGKTEKIEAELHKNLLRPLTETIQHDMKVRSSSAMALYEKRRMDAAAQAESFISISKNIFSLMEVFSNLHNYCVSLPQSFPKRFIEYFISPRFMKEIRENANKCVHLSTAALNILISLLNGTPTPDFVNSITSVHANLLRALYEINCVFSKTSLIRSLCLDYSLRESVNYHLSYLNDNGNAITYMINSLTDYKGNPANVFLPTLKEASLSDHYSFDPAEYIRILTETAENIKADCISVKKDVSVWQSILENDNKSIGDALLKSIKIIGATCIGSSTKAKFNDLEYDVAIVDEAGQIPMHNLLVPLVKVKKFILVGDHIQLPPLDNKNLTEHLEKNFVPRLTEKMEPDEQNGLFYPFSSVGECYSKSLFELLYLRKDEPCMKDHTVMLSHQYRCHPVIADFVSKHFYENKYKNGITGDKRKIDIAGFNKPVYFFDTVNIAQKGEKQHKGSKSYYNIAEAEICAIQVCKIITEIRKDPVRYKDLIDKHQNYDIGIISGYGDQVSYLYHTVKKHLTATLGTTAEAKDEAELIMSRISIDSLDSFQGMEKQIIIFSCTRSNKDCAVGFLNDTRRINVLMTRAKSLLIMVGDSYTLENTNALAKHNKKPVADILSDYITVCKNANCYQQPEIDLPKETEDKE